MMTSKVQGQGRVASLVLLGICAMCAGAAFRPHSNAVPGSDRTRSAKQLGIERAYGRIPLHFEANQGQANDKVTFLTRGSGYSMFLTPTETVLSLSTAHTVTPTLGVGRRRGDGPTLDPSGVKRPQLPGFAPFLTLHGNAALPTNSDVRPFNPQSEIRNRKSTVVRMKLLHANPSPNMAGLDELPGKVNYFIGNDPKKWRSNVATYAKVKYENVYPGVDLIHYGNQRQLEYDFVVAPGADPSRIALNFEGAERIDLNDNGDLALHTSGGDVIQHKPVVYQEVNGERKQIEGSYQLLSTQHSDSQSRPALSTVSFTGGAYDHHRPLVIDPVLSYSTFLGGSGGDSGTGIAVDAAGNAYVTGNTPSADFPTTAGAFQTTSAGYYDVFVTKLNPTGSALVYSTYLGGSGNPGGYSDSTTGIAVDGDGNAYVTGYTRSRDFPTTSGAYQTTFGGGFGHAFVTKLNPAGSALVYSTYLGGSNDEGGSGIAVDADGNAYVTGSASANFPTTAGAFQTAFGGYYAPFVAKLNPAGSALVYSTYLSGSYYGGGYAIAVDATGNAYVTGITSSTDFPTTAGAFQTTHGGGSFDAFVTKLNPAGSALVYSTYLGGSNYDYVGYGTIAVDAGGNAYVTGRTSSADFPTTSGVFQTAFGGGDTDIFVTKLNPAGSALVYSTFLGGSADEYSAGLAVDAGGNAYVTGNTPSADFPTTAGAFQTTFGGYYDAFVTKLNPTGSALVYSTYLGGGGFDTGLGIAVDSAGNAYVTGATNSANFPTTVGAFQTTFHVAFVAKISDDPLDVAITSVTTNLPLVNPNAPLQVLATVTNTGGVDVASVDVLIFLDLNSNLLFDTGEPFQLLTVSNLLAGASQNVAGVFAGPPAGSYLAVAQADPLDLLVETDEGNNVGSTAITVTLSDLKVNNLAYTSTFVAMGKYKVDLKATIGNVGQASASNVMVRFAFSTNGGTFTNIAGPVNAGTIASGATKLAGTSWGGVTPGTHVIKVTVDPGNLIGESNEGNNISLFTIVVP